MPMARSAMSAGTSPRPRSLAAMEVIANDQGNLTTLSCIASTDAWRLIGDAAMNQSAMNPVNRVFVERHTSRGTATNIMVLPESSARWCSSGNGKSNFDLLVSEVSTEADCESSPDMLILQCKGCKGTLNAGVTCLCVALSGNPSGDGGARSRENSRSGGRARS